MSLLNHMFVTHKSSNRMSLFYHMFIIHKSPITRHNNKLIPWKNGNGKQVHPLLFKCLNGD
jgi:hypothetical protein